MAKIKVEYVALGELKAYERNTRTHSKEQVKQLEASITEFGFTNPVLIDEDNVLIAGHGRTEAARALGMAEVPAIRLKGLTEAQQSPFRGRELKRRCHSSFCAAVRRGAFFYSVTRV